MSDTFRGRGGATAPSAGANALKVGRNSDFWINSISKVGRNSDFWINSISKVCMVMPTKNSSTYVLATRPFECRGYFFMLVVVVRLRTNEFGLGAYYVHP